MHCANHKCENGGDCVMKVDMQNGKKYATCRCKQGWEGKHCETASVKTGKSFFYIMFEKVINFFEDQYLVFKNSNFKTLT